MMKITKYLPLLLLPLLFTACATSTITNLTPTAQKRTANGLYPVECSFDTQQRTIQPATLSPQVVVGFDSYPMKQVLRSNNRWETMVPIAPVKKEINYHFKIDYDITEFNKAGKGSKLSPEYKLDILDK